MNESNGLFIESSIANTANTISELDDLIINHKDGVDLNDIKKETRTTNRSFERIGKRARR